MILNGAPRSGKSSIAAALPSAVPGDWVALGVDSSMASTPADLLPGIGLRPGGERPDLEPYIETAYFAPYDSVIDHARPGASVGVDVGPHDGYSRPRHLLPRVAGRLAGLPAWLVGVRCPIDVIMQRRDDSAAGYVGSAPDGSVPAEVRRWETAVHDPGIYDLTLDTSVLSPAECAAAIATLVTTKGSATALAHLATLHHT